MSTADQTPLSFSETAERVRRRRGLGLNDSLSGRSRLVGGRRTITVMLVGCLLGATGALALSQGAVARETQPAPRVALVRLPDGTVTTADWTDVDTRPAMTAMEVGASVAALARESCPDDMLEVRGNYCTEVEHECVAWLDDPKLPYARCQRYAPKATCVGEWRPMAFCMDRTEYTPVGATLPANHMSFMKATEVCAEQGKRVCTESEWNFACEGEEMLPYPYGWERKPVCNQDRTDLREKVDNRWELKDHRWPSGSQPACASPFGVMDMAGNLDEPTLNEAARYNPPFRTALKGGWWMAARNRCRPATVSHDDYYEDVQVGVRCCADAVDAGDPTG